jgi:hypothetical protein
LAQKVIELGPAANAGTPDLTLASAVLFNVRTLPNLTAATVFNTVSADADTNNNQKLDRSPDEYAELRAESPELQALDNQSQSLSQIAMNRAYQILRTTARADVKEVQRGGKLTLVVTAIHPQQEMGNDVLVTIPSGNGASSIAPRVKNKKEYTGPGGRNHSSVANAGVASDVVPWLIDVEKSIGDLKPDGVLP